MSFTEGTAHLFRQRHLRRRLEALAAAEIAGEQREDDGGGFVPTAAEGVEDPLLGVVRNAQIPSATGTIAAPARTTARTPRYHDESFTEDFLFSYCANDNSSSAYASGGEDALSDVGPMPLTARSVLSNSSYFPPRPALDPTTHRRSEKWLRVFASCVVITSNGVQYSLSQFIPHTPSMPMSAAISLLICGFTLGCILHGCFLMHLPCIPSPRVAVLATSPIVLSLLLSIPATRQPLEGGEGGAALLFASFFLTGLGIGPSYLSAIVHLQFWLPEAPALACSVGMAFGGLGSVGMAWAISATIADGGTDLAFACLAATLFLLQFLGGLFIRMPDLPPPHVIREELILSRRTLHAPSHGPLETLLGESKANLAISAAVSPAGVDWEEEEWPWEDLGIELGVWEVLLTWQFACFWVAAFTAVGPGFAIFANLATVLTKDLGLSDRTTATWIVTINLIATGESNEKWNERRCTRRCTRSSERIQCFALFAFFIHLCMGVATSCRNDGVHLRCSPPRRASP